MVTQLIAMKKYIFTLMFSLFALGLQAQNLNEGEIAIGDILEVGKPESTQYEHIEFPKPNFIIKRGGLANYKRVEGNKVVVTSIKEKKDGSVRIKIKKTDGSRFFGSHWQVAANIKEALESGELRRI
jgi:hypothetical protein